MRRFAKPAPMALAVPCAEATENLQQKTKESWERYKSFTESRINDELSKTSTFLRLDSMSVNPSDARIARGKSARARSIGSITKGK